jgi:hypothetical protein
MLLIMLKFLQIREISTNPQLIISNYFEFRFKSFQFKFKNFIFEFKIFEFKFKNFEFKY